MKYLSSTFLIGVLAVVIHAQTPESKPGVDPFVKGPAGAAAGDNAQAGARFPDNPDVVVVFDAYSLKRNDAADLLATETGSVARYRRVLEMEKAGQAHLQILTALDTISGLRAVVEAIDEIRLATNFNSSIPGNAVPTPIEWETRNAGDHFEIEVVVDPDQKICDLNLVTTRLTLAGFRDDAGVTGDPATSQPVFQIQQITTSISAFAGEPVYLGSMTPPPAAAADRGAASAEVWLAFVHSMVKKLPPPDKNPPNQEGPVLASLIYSCYSLDRKAARDILVTPSSVDAPWEKVKALLAEKKAQLEFVTSARTKSGQREVVEEVQEVRYMAECVPPSLVNTSESGTIVDSKGETSNLSIPHTPSNAQRIAGYGSKFDTRSAGITVEVEPVIGPDGKQMQVNHVIQNVVFRGMLKVTGVGANYQPQPVFGTSKVTAVQALTAGKTELVSTLNPPGADGVNDREDTGRTWLLFIHAAVDLP